MQTLRNHPVLVGLVAAGILAALVVGGYRHRVEAAYRTVEVIVDGADWRILAQREGRLDLAFWKALRERGATSVALYEATLRQLKDEGRVTYWSGVELRDLWRAGGLRPALQPLAASADPASLYVIPADPEAAQLVLSGFSTALGSHRVAQVFGEPLVLRVLGRPRDLEQTALGFPFSSVQRWQALGFGVVLRPRNVRSFDRDRLRKRIATYEPVVRGRLVVFDLNEVLGYERLVEEAAQALRSAGAVYGRVEVLTPARRMRGEDAMTRSMRPRVARVISIVPEELERLSVEDAVDRFVRGVRERNLRGVYVRPYLQTPGGVDAVAFNLDYLGRVTRALRSAGFELGPAQPMPELAVPQALRGLVLAASTASGLLLLAAVGEAAGWPLRAPVGLGLLAAGLLAAWAGEWAGLGVWVSKLWALLAAVAFPTLALLTVVPGQGPAGLGGALASLWKAGAVSSLGGLVVAALLSDWTFRLAAETFFGVKLATVVPPLLVGAVYLVRQDAEPHAMGVGALARKLYAWLARPVTLGAVLAVAAASGAVLLLLLRTGNTGLPLPAVEERLREALERTLVARPRTKEYLLGHPALVLAVASGALGLRRWTVPLLLVAAVGQAGLVNSFSHAHTPLLYTVWRTANGLALGTLVGGLLYASLRWLLHLVPGIVAVPSRVSDLKTPAAHPGPRP